MPIRVATSDSGKYCFRASGWSSYNKLTNKKFSQWEITKLWCSFLPLSQFPPPSAKLGGKGVLSHFLLYFLCLTSQLQTGIRLDQCPPGSIYYRVVQGSFPSSNVPLFRLSLVLTICLIPISASGIFPNNWKCLKFLILPQYTAWEALLNPPPLP